MPSAPGRHQMAWGCVPAWTTWAEQRPVWPQAAAGGTPGAPGATAGVCGPDRRIRRSTLASLLRFQIKTSSSSGISDGQRNRHDTGQQQPVERLDVALVEDSGCAGGDGPPGLAMPVGRPPGASAHRCSRCLTASGPTGKPAPGVSAPGVLSVPDTRRWHWPAARPASSNQVKIVFADRNASALCRGVEISPVAARTAACPCSAPAARGRALTGPPEAAHVGVGRAGSRPCRTPRISHSTAGITRRHDNGMPGLMS